MHVIYKWYPLTVGKIDNNSNLVINKINSMPEFFRNIRGSTNGLIMKDKSSEIWFVCHLVSDEDRRYYYHYLVVLDVKTLEFKRNHVRADLSHD